MCEGLGLSRMAEGDVVKRAFKRIVTGKSLPGIVVHAIIATLLGTGDLVSETTTCTVNLPLRPPQGLGHLGPATRCQWSR